MGSLLNMFGERPLVDCIKKLDATFVVDLGSWLGFYREELVPNFVRLYTLSTEWSELDWYGAPTNYVL
jgi:hypothetical protein